MPFGIMKARSIITTSISNMAYSKLQDFQLHLFRYSLLSSLAIFFLTWPLEIQIYSIATAFKFSKYAFLKEYTVLHIFILWKYIRQSAWDTFTCVFMLKHC